MSSSPLPAASSGTTASRRAVVVGGCAGALAACFAGCARYGRPAGAAATPPAPSPGPGGITVPASGVPVGGGVVLADRNVVVTQPTAGRFAAFDATCPHQGCTVNEVADGLISCPCHGSAFRVADGSVANGPATTGLPRRRAALAGSTVRVT